MSNSAKLANSTTTAMARIASQPSAGTSLARRGLGNMSGPFRVVGAGRGRSNLDGPRRGHRDDDDQAAGRQIVEGGHGLVLHDAVLQFQMDLARAGLVAGNGQVDGSGRAHGAVDARGAVGAEAGQTAHGKRDQEQGADAGG